MQGSSSPLAEAPSGMEHARQLSVGTRPLLLTWDFGTSQRWKTGSQKAHAKFREFLDAQGAVVTEIEGGAFRESGTLVPTLRIRLVKKAAHAVLELVPEQPSFFPERKKPQRPERPQADLAQMSLAI